MAPRHTRTSSCTSPGGTVSFRVRDRGHLYPVPVEVRPIPLVREQRSALHRLAALLGRTSAATGQRSGPPSRSARDSRSQRSYATDRRRARPRCLAGNGGTPPPSTTSAAATGGSAYNADVIAGDEQSAVHNPAEVGDQIRRRSDHQRVHRHRDRPKRDQGMDPQQVGAGRLSLPCAGSGPAASRTSTPLNRFAPVVFTERERWWPTTGEVDPTRLSMTDEDGVLFGEAVSDHERQRVHQHLEAQLKSGCGLLG